CFAREGLCRCPLSPLFPTPSKSLYRRRLKEIEDVPLAAFYFFARCHSTSRIIFDAARWRAYATKCGGTLTGSKPCPCALFLFLTVGNPDSRALRNPEKWVAISGGTIPLS